MTATLNRKQQRALLARLRQLCLRGSAVRLITPEQGLTATAVSLDERSFTSVEQPRDLVVRLTAPGPALEVRAFCVVLARQLVEVAVARCHANDDRLELTFAVGSATFVERRSAPRTPFDASFASPVMMQLRDDRVAPVFGRGRWRDRSATTVSIELALGDRLTAEDLRDATLFVHEDRTDPVRVVELRVAAVRELCATTEYGVAMTTATVIAHSTSFAAPPGRSVLSVPVGTQLAVSRLGTGADRDWVAVDAVTETGFEGRFAARTGRLPMFIEAADTEIRFAVRRHDDAFSFELASRDMGMRTQWYNLLTRLVRQTPWGFVAGDAEAVTDLVQESGNYRPALLRERLLRSEYFDSRWELEHALPRTRHRFVGRASDGRVIGHTSVIRVSRTLWAAVDNIGSQAFTGRWNRDGVAPWLRVAAELLAGDPDRPGVQWTFKPAAGIWNEFDIAVTGTPDMVLCRDRVWDLVADDPESPRRERERFVEAPITAARAIDLCGAAGPSAATFLAMLNDGLRDPCAFTADFRHDFGFELERHHRQVAVGDLEFVLSWTNYPAWVGLNRTHDFAYVLPLRRPSRLLSLAEERSLVQVIKEILFVTGCNPLRILSFAEERFMPSAAEWINMVITPGALALAADFAERT